MRRVFVSDFDGTMTRRDFFQLALERLVPPETPDFWAEYEAGRVSHFEAMRSIFASIRSSREEMEAVLDAMDLDPEIPVAAQGLREAGWSIVVASAGCGWYIHRLLHGKLDAPVHASPGEFVPGGGLRMELPEDSAFRSLRTGIDKGAVVRWALRTHDEVAFAGDGRPDLEAARLVPADHRFARGLLAELLLDEGLAFHRFERWSEVARQLVQAT